MMPIASQAVGRASDAAGTVDRPSMPVHNDDSCLEAGTVYDPPVSAWSRVHQGKWWCLLVLKILAVVACAVGLAMLFTPRPTGQTSVASKSLSSAAAVHSRTPKPLPEPYNISFFVVGDWGVTAEGKPGSENQTLTANLMGTLGDSLKPEFVVSVGDNFYPDGLHANNAEFHFNGSFVNVYTALSLQVPWYAVLGNHDYHPSPNMLQNSTYCQSRSHFCFDGPVQEMDSRLRVIDPRWHLQRNYQLLLADGQVEFLFIDTMAHLVRYHDQPWVDVPEQVNMNLSAWSADLMELEARLAASTAQWKLVVGHHPVWSGGKHGNTSELIQRLDPVLQAHGVQAYFAGHDHDLEHLNVPGKPLHYVISGAGGICDRYMAPHPYSRWSWPSSGFVACNVDPEQLQCHFYNLEDTATQPKYRIALPRTP